MYYVSPSLKRKTGQINIPQGDEELGVFSHVITPALANVEEYRISKHTTHTREARRVVTK